MNEQLPAGKQTKQEAFLPVNEVCQRNGTPCEVPDLNNCQILIRSKHHFKRHFENTEISFCFGERTVTLVCKENEEIKGNSVPFPFLFPGMERQFFVKYKKNHLFKPLPGPGVGS